MDIRHSKVAKKWLSYLDMDNVDFGIEKDLFDLYKFVTSGIGPGTGEPQE